MTGAVSGLSTPYASGVTYAPQGGVAQINLHNGLSEQTTYNPRLQPGSIQLGSLLTLTYGYSSTNNNGNLASQTIASPLTAGGTLTAQQVYTYDGVNRLLKTQETVQSGLPSGTAAGNWTLNDGNDQYGNHWATTALSMGRQCRRCRRSSMRRRTSCRSGARAWRCLRMHTTLRGICRTIRTSGR